MLTHTYMFDEMIFEFLREFSTSVLRLFPAWFQLLGVYIFYCVLWILIYFFSRISNIYKGGWGSKMGRGVEVKTLGINAYIFTLQTFINMKIYKQYHLFSSLSLFLLFLLYFITFFSFSWNSKVGGGGHIPHTHPPPPPASANIGLTYSRSKSNYWLLYLDLHQGSIRIRRVHEHRSRIAKRSNRSCTDC